MSMERELLIGAVEWMHELKYVWADERDSGDWVLLELIADINKIEKLLNQPEHIVDVTDKVEPVAWRCNLLGNVITDKPADNNSYTPLYKSPPKRKTLSGKESEALWEAEFKSAISYLVFDEICVAINQHTV